MTPTAVLQPGTYRLRYDIKNPAPDRRANQSRLSSWESWAIWPAGLLFTVEIDREYPTINRIRPQGGIRQMSPHDAGFKPLAENLERVQEQPSDYIIRNGAGLVQHYALGILDRLNIPVERIAEIMEEMDAENGE